MSWVDLLPEPRGKRFARTVHWVRTRAPKYPFAAKTAGTSLRPQTVEEQCSFYFLRIPFARSDFTVWAFETEANREVFLREFAGNKYEND